MRKFLIICSFEGANRPLRNDDTANYCQAQRCVSSFTQFWQINLPLISVSDSSLPQSAQASVAFLSVTPSSLSTKRTSSHLLTFSALRISLGITTLPSSSILFTNTHSFIVINFPYLIYIVDYHLLVYIQYNAKDVASQYKIGKNKHLFTFWY